MFRLLSHPVRLALLLAGLLGIAPVGAAPTTEADRSWEIAVEMAWMGDPATFRCPLRAHCTASGLEVSGRVPDSVARQRALQLARQNFKGHVHASLTIGRVRGGYAPGSPEEIYRGVVKALTDVIGEQAHRIEVTTRGDGEVTLHGQVASLEEKYAVSARLRKVSGCACVVNLLEVAAALTKNQPAIKKTIAAVPPPMKQVEPKPVPMAETMVIEEKAAPPKKHFALWNVFSKSEPRPTPMTTTVVKQAPPIAKAAHSGEVKTEAKNEPHKLPASVQARQPAKKPAAPMESYPEAEPLLPQGESASSKAALAHSLMSPYGVRHVTTQAQDEVIADTAPSKTTPPPIASSNQPSGTRQPSSRTQTYATPEPLRMMPSRAMPMPSGSHQVAKPAIPTEPYPKAERLQPGSEFASEVIPYPPQKAPGQRKPDTVQMMPSRAVVTSEMSEPAPAKPRGLFARLFKREHPVPSETVVTIPGPAPTPTRTVLPSSRPTVTAKATIPDHPYVTTGTVIFHDGSTPAVIPTAPTPVRRQPATPSLPRSATALRQKIVAACGKTAKDVQVQVKQDGSMEVTIKVSQSAFIEEVLNKTSGLPGLTSTPNFVVEP